MQYSFDVDEAIQYGVNEAIMIWNFRFWVIKNKANNKHYHEGRTWTYNSIKAYEKLFPFWTTRQIRTILDNLLKKEILVKGNFNQNSYDRTAWYAFSNENKFVPSSLNLSDLSDLTNGDVKTICQDSQIHLSNLTNGNVKSDKYIKDTDIKPDIKPYFFPENSDKKNANLEDLKKYKEEKKYLSDVEEFYLFHERKSWKNVINRFAEFDYWEHKFKKDNPSLYLDNIQNNETYESDKESEEIKELRHKIKFVLGNSGYPNASQFFEFCKIEESNDKFVVYCSNSKALEYQEILKDIGVEIKKVEN